MTQIFQDESSPRKFAHSVSNADGVIGLYLRGDIDLATHDRFREIVEALISGEGMTAISIDLARVTFLDCGGIGVLVAGRMRADQAGCGYRVVNATGIVARVIEVTGSGPFLGHSLTSAEGHTPISSAASA